MDDRQLGRQLEHNRPRPASSEGQDGNPVGSERERSEAAATAGRSSSGEYVAAVDAEVFEREEGSSILDQVESELEDVERALRRLDQGTYGTCEVCGQPIEEERLRVRPEARFCSADQELAGREARRNFED